MGWIFLGGVGIPVGTEIGTGLELEELIAFLTAAAILALASGDRGLRTPVLVFLGMVSFSRR